MKKTIILLGSVLSMIAYGQSEKVGINEETPLVTLDVKGNVRAQHLKDDAYMLGKASAEGGNTENRKPGVLIAGPEGVITRTTGLELNARFVQPTANEAQRTLGINDYVLVVGEAKFATITGSNNNATTIILPDTEAKGRTIGRSYIIRNNTSKELTLSQEYMSKNSVRPDLNNSRNAGTNNTTKVGAGQSIMLVYTIVTGNEKGWVEINYGDSDTPQIVTLNGNNHDLSNDYPKKGYVFDGASNNTFVLPKCEIGREIFFYAWGGANQKANFVFKEDRSKQIGLTNASSTAYASIEASGITWTGEGTNRTDGQTTGPKTLTLTQPANDIKFRYKKLSFICLPDGTWGFVHP